MIQKNQLDDLTNTLLQALAQLDIKGTNLMITQAMPIVYEGFERHANQLEFSAEDLVAISKKHIETCI